MEKKQYSMKKFGDGKSPHLLENKDDVSDILALCSCGCSEDIEKKCDGSHIKGLLDVLKILKKNVMVRI